MPFIDFTTYLPNKNFRKTKENEFAPLTKAIWDWCGKPEKKWAAIRKSIMEVGKEATYTFIQKEIPRRNPKSRLDYWWGYCKNNRPKWNERIC